MPALRHTFILGSIVLAATSACSRQASPPATEPSAPVTVHVATARSDRALLTQAVTGTLRPADYAMVSAKVSGAVGGANFILGQRVTAGEYLLTLQADELAARLAQANALLDQAKRDFIRESGLLAKGAVTVESVRALEDRQRGAIAAVNEARAMLTYTRVTAPFDGVITRKYVQNGDLAQPGAPLFAIDGLGDLRAEVEVPSSLPSLPLETALQVELSSGTATGKLVELSTAADPQSRTRLAKVALFTTEGVSARSGDFVRVLWPAGEATSITIPAEALTAFGQMERVFVVSESRARLRLVKSAGVADGLARIAAGLAAGETVVLAPSASVRDGQPVEVLP